MIHQVTGGVPLQVANLIAFDFSIEDYQDNAVKCIITSLGTLEKKLPLENFKASPIVQWLASCIWMNLDNIMIANIPFNQHVISGHITSLSSNGASCFQ
jgi:hypothetical protein